MKTQPGLIGSRLGTAVAHIVHVVVATAALSLATPALSQLMLEEIVVTAQKREQNLQDVPIAITALDSGTLENLGIDGLEDVGRMTPGVYVTPGSADANAVLINIRGIGVLDPQVGVDGRIAIYQDGVYLGKTQGLAFDMPDLERVEIVKGPQGTLYGRNTVGGAVNLISAAPNPDEFTGKVKAEYGEFDHQKVSGAINLPLGDAAALRLSGLYQDRDGWVENKGQGSDFGGESKWGFRGALSVDVTDRFNLSIATDFNDVEKEPLFYQATAAADHLGRGQPFRAAHGRASGSRLEEVTINSFAPEKGDLESKGMSVVGTWDLAEGHELKVTIARREVDSSRFTTLTPTVNPAILNATTNGFNAALGALGFAFQTAGQTLRPDFNEAFFVGGPPSMQNPTGMNITRDGLFLSAPGGAATLEGHKQDSFELTYNGDFMDGRVEFTGGFFYFDEETGNNRRPPAAGGDAADYLFILGQYAPQVTASNIAGYPENHPFAGRAFLDGIDSNPMLDDHQPYDADARGPIPAAGILLQQIASSTAPALLAQLVGDGTCSTESTFANGGITNPVTNAVVHEGFPTLSCALSQVRASSSNPLSIETEAWALYGQATYHVTDRLRLTLGLRYSDETKDGLGQPVSGFFRDNIDLTGGTIDPNISSFDDTFLDPALTVEFDLAEDVMAYVSYKESFRSGGFNQTAVKARLAGRTYGSDFNFGAEEISAYELGVKGALAGRFRFDAAVFYYDFTDRQTTVRSNPLIGTERVIVNVDDDIYGVEGDFAYSLTESFSLSGSISYIDGDPGDVPNLLCRTCAPTVKRDKLQGTPELSWLVALNYSDEWWGNEVYGNVSYSYKDEIIRIPSVTDATMVVAATELPDFYLMNARLGTIIDLGYDTELNVALWATNLLDEEYLVDALNFESFAHRVEVYGPPRAVGVALGYNF